MGHTYGQGSLKGSRSRATEPQSCVKILCSLLLMLCLCLMSALWSCKVWHFKVPLLVYDILLYILCDGLQWYFGAVVATISASVSCVRVFEMFNFCFGLCKQIVFGLFEQCLSECSRCELPLPHLFSPHFFFSKRCEIKILNGCLPELFVC